MIWWLAFVWVVVLCFLFGENLYKKVGSAMVFWEGIFYTLINQDHRKE